MANRNGLALMISLIVPAVACTAVTGLGKSYEFGDGGETAGDASTTDAPSSADGAKSDGSVTGTQCPSLIAGAYTMTQSGDCGNVFDKNAKECVSTTTTVSDVCALQFVSSSVGVNGTLDAQHDGTFRSGQITVGSTRHINCSATWQPPALTLTCPADIGTGVCTITMTRAVPPTCL
jgi:hypothetical protein